MRSPSATVSSLASNVMRRSGNANPCCASRSSACSMIVMSKIDPRGSAANVVGKGIGNMIKKTRWSFSVSVAPSQAIIRTPWPRPHTPYLHAFKAHAQRYRRRKRLALSLMIGFMVVGVLIMSINVPNEVAIWGGGLMAASWLFAVLIFVTGLRLRCPACKKRLEPARGLYCPACGSGRFDYGRHKIGPVFARYLTVRRANSRLLRRAATSLAVTGSEDAPTVASCSTTPGYEEAATQLCEGRRPETEVRAVALRARILARVQRRGGADRIRLPSRTRMCCGVRLAD